MKIINFFVVIFFLFILKINNAYSLIEVDITRGNLDPLPIAVSPLSLEKKDKSEFTKLLELDDLGIEISKVIENNLRKTGLFNTLSKGAFLQKPDIAHLKPRFEDWTLIKAQALITGKVIFEDVEVKGWIRIAMRASVGIIFILLCLF